MSNFKHAISPEFIGQRASPEKVARLFDSYKLKLFDSERILIDQMIPFDPDALYAVSYQI